MAVCSYCNQEMKNKVSCIEDEITIGKKDYKQIPVSEDLSHEGYCHDCGAPVGGFHHPGCDAERCPICQGQIISCGCGEDDD